MHNDYNLVKSVTHEEFDKFKPSDAELEAKYTKADEEEVRKMERLLDVQPGTLTPAGPFYLEKGECACCSRTLTTYDFVFTALVDANHSKSLILHTMTGTKLVLQQPRVIKCSNCGEVTPKAYAYRMTDYGCSTF